MALNEQKGPALTQENSNNDNNNNKNKGEEGGEDKEKRATLPRSRSFATPRAERRKSARGEKEKKPNRKVNQTALSI